MQDYTYKVNLPQQVLLKQGNISGEDYLKKEKQQITFFEKELMTVKGKGCIVLDFGKEYFGYLKLLICKIQTEDYHARIRIRLGESVAECCAELGYKCAGNYHGIRDMTENVSQFMEYQTGLNGFRFVRIDFLDDCVFELINCQLVSREENVNNVGYFRCDDELLNRIFDTAVRTVTLCQQNGLIWDGIKRDRIVWIGDLMPEALAVFNLSFDIERVFSCLELARKEVALPSWINSIPCYSLWYILVLWELYRYSGEKEYLDVNSDFVTGVLSQVNCGIDENGNINFQKIAFDEDMTFFLDWESFDTEDAVTGVRSFIVYSMKIAHKLLEVLNIEDVYTDEIIGKIGNFYSVKTERKQIKAFQCLAANRISEQDVDVLMKNGSAGLTCFMSYFILKVLCSAGKTETALQMIKDYYGGMLKLGATTFFEDFNSEWLKDNPLSLTEFETEGKKNIHADYGRFCYEGFKHSLCHGWSSGIIPLIFEEIVGIKQLEVGYKTISIAPCLCGLKFVEAGIPTSFGLIELKIYEKNGRTVIEKTIPKGIKINDKN